MKELNDFIQENARSFNSFEPGEDHFLNFQKKMIKKNVYREIFHKIRYAAAILLLISVGTTATFFILNENKVTAVNNPMSEIDTYYTEKLDNSMNEFLFLKMNQTEKDMILKEVSEIDSLRSKLSDEYIMSGQDPKVEEAIIQHYETKLRILNRIVTKMKKVNQSKTNSYEKVSN